MGSSTCICVTVVVICIAVALVLIGSLVGTSLKKLESHEVGLQYNVHTKKLGTEEKREGLHLGPVGFEFVTFSNTFTTMEFQFTCMNADGVDIRISAAYQYRVILTKLRDVILEFKDEENWARTLRKVGVSTVNEACTYFNTTQFQVARANFTSTVRNLMDVSYKKLHAQISDLQIKNYDRPDNFEKAVTRKEAAREDINVAVSEHDKKIVVAETERQAGIKNAEIEYEQAVAEHNITINKALRQAEGIIHAYAKEAETYASIISTLNLTSEGFLSYLGIRVISSAKNPVFLGLGAPAASSYVP